MKKNICKKCQKQFIGYSDHCSYECGKSAITGRPREDEVERFWSKVNKSGDCWEWIASKFHHGHGKFWLNGKNIKAHRYSYELQKGPIPDGLQINHRCNNSSCVNPAHLYLGDHNQNMKDLSKSNRLKGERNPKAQINSEIVKEIRRLYESENHSQPKLSELFGVSKDLIHKVVNYKTWKHI